MKFSKMVKLAVKWTCEERRNLLANSAQLSEQVAQERYDFCLRQAWMAGDKDRYNKLIAAGVADC